MVQLANYLFLGRAAARRLVVVTLAAAASFVDAAQPLVTDDAAVVPPKTCQVEAWKRSGHDARALAVAPACNPTGNLELAFGGARETTDGSGSSNIVALQAKTVLFALGEGAWSFGIVAGGARDTTAPHGATAFQGRYAKALASWCPREDLELDLNLGAANDYGTGTSTLAGAAIQYSIADNVQLLAEAIHDESGQGRYQLGARLIVLPDRFEAYASYGNRFSGPSERWSAVIGVRVQTAAFLP